MNHHLVYIWNSGILLLRGKVWKSFHAMCLALPYHVVRVTVSMLVFLPATRSDGSHVCAPCAVSHRVNTLPRRSQQLHTWGAERSVCY